MAAFRFSILKSFSSSIYSTSRMASMWSGTNSMNASHCTNSILSRSSFVSHQYHTSNMRYNQFRILSLPSLLDTQRCSVDPVAAISPKCLQNSRLSYSNSQSVVFPAWMSYTSHFRSYSSFFGNKGDTPQDPKVSSTSVVNEPDSNTIDLGGSDWADSLKHAWQSVLDAATFTAQKAKEASNELTPYVEQLLDTHPYLKNVIIPIGWTVTATALAWLVMPRLLRKFHKYSMQGPAAFLSGSFSQEQIPYEKSFWGALEDPLRYLITFMAFSQIAVMIAPTTVASQFIGNAWRGAVILSFVWFLHRWKTNVFSRALATQSALAVDRERLLALDKLSSVGLFVLGVMALAEACGVAVQSLLTVGGIGGVATAFAARDILGNVLSGLSMQFSKPFSLGDTIKAGSVEGQVVEMGLTSTLLLNAQKFPVVVPNSLFSSQVIVNKTRAQWRAFVTKIPLQISSLEKIPLISEDIKSMLRSNRKTFLGKESPYCFLSRIETSFAELSIGCNLINMSKDELYSTEQDILLQAVQIIKKHGASLGSSLSDLTNH